MCKLETIEKLGTSASLSSNYSKHEVTTYIFSSLNFVFGMLPLDLSFWLGNVKYGRQQLFISRQSSTGNNKSR